MKKAVKKLLVSVITSSLTLLVACSPSTPETNQAAQGATTAPGANQAASEKLTIWAWDPNFNIDIMNNAAARYQKLNPGVEIEVVEMSKADVEQKLHTNLASKMTQGLPDIVLIEDYNAQKYLQSYPGSFAELTDVFPYSDFASYKVELMTLDNKIYGVPFDAGAIGFFYRADLLEEAGFQAADLKNITWDQFIEIGKEVRTKTGKAFLSFDKADGGLIRVMLQSAGQWYFNSDGSTNIVSNGALKEGMEIYKKIVEADIIKPTSGWNDWVGAFNTGDAASVTSGVWILGSIKAAADQSGKWALAPVPKLSSVDSVNASNLGGSSWYILENTGNKELAVDFMNKIYVEDIDFYQDILTKNGAVATYMPAHSGEAYMAADEFFGGQHIFEEISGYIKEIPSINYGLYTYEADAALMGQIDDVVAGKKTVENALTAAEEQLKHSIQ